MNFSKLKYVGVYVTPALALLSILSNNWWSFSAVIFAYGFIPFVELFMRGSTENMTKIEEQIAKEDRFYDWMLYGLVPFHYMIMFFFLYRIGNASIPMYAKIGMTTAYGLSCAGFGINLAHELGHRTKWYEQLMSKMLLLTTLYMHFFIEHNRGHHKNVSTDEDPASSRYGEWVYAFYFRSVIGGYLSAWKLEAQRLKKQNKAVISIYNEMLWYQAIQIGLLVLIGFVFGIQTLLFFIVGATIGFLLLETVNYIEHYGLRRKKKGEVYERTLPIHSWNSNHPLGRIFLLELTRHSDHHYLAGRKYQTLRHFDDAPQMPTGYPGMIMLSLIPPLWFRVMHKQIDKYKQQAHGVALG